MAVWMNGEEHSTTQHSSPARQSPGDLTHATAIDQFHGPFGKTAILSSHDVCFTCSDELLAAEYHVCLLEGLYGDRWLNCEVPQ
jgi:hypothetical protein